MHRKKTTLLNTISSRPPKAACPKLSSSLKTFPPPRKHPLPHSTLPTPSGQATPTLEPDRERPDEVGNPTPHLRTFNRTRFATQPYRFSPPHIERILNLIASQQNFHLDPKSEITQGIVPNPDVLTPRNLKKISPEIQQKHNLKPGQGVFVLNPEEATTIKPAAPIPPTPTQPSTPTPTQPSTPNSNQPSTPTPTQPIPPTQPSTPTPTQPSTPNSNQPNTPNAIHPTGPPLMPLYAAAQVDRFFLPATPSKYILYLTPKNLPEIPPSPLKNHLQKFREIMEARRENQKGRIQYFHLHWPRNPRFFSAGPKILSVRKCKHPTFVFTEDPAYVMLSFNVIKTNRIDMRYLTGLLNSKLMEFWLKHRGKIQGNHYQVDRAPLLTLPILQPNHPEKTQRIIQLVKRIEEQKKEGKDSTPLENKLDSLIFRLYNLGAETVALIRQDLAPN